jgi:exoribonuclease-2
MKQEQVARVAATVLKEDLLRLDGLPFVTRVPGIPALPRGQRVELDVIGRDEIELTLEARLHQVLAASVVAEQGADEDEDDEADVQAQAESFALAAVGAAQGVPPAADVAPGPEQPDRSSDVTS